MWQIHVWIIAWILDKIGLSQSDNVTGNQVTFVQIHIPKQDVCCTLIDGVYQRKLFLVTRNYYLYYWLINFHNPNLTQPQPQPNITKVGFNMKMTLKHHPPAHLPHKLNVSNISIAVTDPILTKLYDRFPGINNNNMSIKQRIIV